MKKIFALLMFVLMTCFWGCSDFLNETPNKSGSAYIYHMDQLYGLTGNINLYRTGYCWTDFILRGDAIEYTPYHVVRASAGGNAYQIWRWDNTYLQTEGMNNCTWTPVWNAVYSFNTVLENMDNVIQTTPAIRKQVEGEALFGRAYFHFIALAQYALWDENAPGIGYRTNTSPSDSPSRQTVKYTLERIYQDLDDAEAALTAAGRTDFELSRNFRPTIPTLKALRARIDLYRGTYPSALKNANAALEAYNYLLDFKNNEALYKV
ncbi:MAG: RagB/SusD family nutrient uptake outer membrane protein, partial [Tannerella sp.]|nr:RagB/SusD family nutrient uptake outer membrane protein [Tannerella sp.]